MELNEALATLLHKFGIHLIHNVDDKFGIHDVHNADNKGAVFRDRHVIKAHNRPSRACRL